MNVSIRASAGSGKTYALTTEYLRLLRRQHLEIQAAPAGAGRLQPEALLASTFTRKAAGEIFDRVLSRLAAASLHPKGLEELRGALKEQTLTATDCQDLLLRLCRSLNRVNVGTLDSFFQRLYAAYRQEAGLSSSVSITDPKSPRGGALAREAIRALLDDLSPAEADNLLDDINSGKAGLSVANKFQEALGNLLELAEDIPAAAWEKLQPPKRPSDSAVAAAQAALEEALPNLPNKFWKNAVQADLGRFNQGAWEKFANTGIAATCLDERPVYRGDQVPVPVRAAYETLLDVARCELLPPHQRRTRAIGHLLKAYVEKYAALRQAEGMILFSEAPRLLAPLLGDMAETARRMDMRIGHVLLDEFQDTSLPQWNVIGKFAEEASTAPDSVFLVGDVKQAIYGWRGGRAELFELAEDQIADLISEPRDISYRSSQAVLDSVNAVFGALDQCVVLEPQAEARARWQGGFQNHTAYHQDLPGFVELSAPPNNDPAKSQRAQSVDKIAEWIGRLPSSVTVGVLVRSNDTVGEMTDLLRAHPVDVSSEGKGAITDDPAVEVILSTLTFADHPGHTAAAYHAAHSPLNGALGIETADLADAQKMRAAATGVRRRLLAEGYAGVLADWSRLLAPHGLDRTGRRLEQLVEQAASFDLLPPMRPSEFVRAMREVAAENPGTARVRVMTINGAKGLEFDVVFLPDLEWGISARTPKCLILPNSLAEIAAGEATVKAVYSYPKETLRRLDKGMQAAYEAYRGEEVTGLLCLLYVAMTRARHSLHLFVGGAGSGITPAKVLCEALGVAVPGAAPRATWETLRQWGTKDWHTQAETRETPVASAAPPARPALRFRASEGIRRGSPAHRHEDATKMATDLLQLK